MIRATYSCYAKASIGDAAIKYLVAVIVVLSFWAHGFAYSFKLNVQPKTIDCGDTVIISQSCDGMCEASVIRIITPSLKEYELEPVKRGGRCEVRFCETFDRGFLREDWNIYQAKLVDRNGLCLDSSSFMLRPQNKRLFFTVYVDDVGKAGFLREDGEAWFKSIGGQINYGYQYDDWGGIRLRRILDRYDKDSDFIFHHFHAWQSAGSRFLFYTDHVTDWNRRKQAINGFFKVDLRDRHYVFLFVALLTGSTVLVLYTRSRTSIIIMATTALLCGIGVAAIVASHHVNNFDNWELRLDDPAWCKSFLAATKHEFEANGLQYPYLVRHGWNVPPYGLNRFYIEQMGVLADASLIFPNTSKFSALYPDKDYGPLINRVKEYAYEWNENIPLPVPYYTNIKDEFNVLWDGIEAHRGILEMPVVLSNLIGYGLDANDKGIIDALPDGALVSTYLHPADDLRELQEAIEYIAQNYDIIFTSAGDYLDLYMSHFPRPVWIDFVAEQSSWAYWDNDTVYKIAVCKAVQMDSGTVHVNAETPPPYVILSGHGADIQQITSGYDLVTIVSGGTRIYRRRNITP